MKKILNYIFSKTGLHVIKGTKFKGSTKFEINELQYEVVTPTANYAPWCGDEEFKKIHLEIKGNTLVDKYRCFEIWQLVEMVHKLDTTAQLIEVGVWRGGTAGIIARKLTLLGSRATLFLADTFTGVAKATDNDKFYNGGEHADTTIETVDFLLKNKYQQYKILQGIFPEDTAHLIPSEDKFGLCHIDVDVYESAKDIVNWIWDKMIVGGIIVFDDYGFHTCDGVTKYVNEQKNKTDRVIIHNLNGHALMIKIK